MSNGTKSTYAFPPGRINLVVKFVKAMARFRAPGNPNPPARPRPARRNNPRQGPAPMSLSARLRAYKAQNGFNGVTDRQHRRAAKKYTLERIASAR